MEDTSATLARPFRSDFSINSARFDLMRRVEVVVLLLAACGDNGATKPAQGSAPPPAPAVKPLGPISGAHGGAINAIAVTSDGTAAVTADLTGGVRLWPTLDGTREPIVVKAPAPAALAMAREGASFAIVVTDAANQAELIRVDAKGNVRSRHRLGEALQIEAVGEALLALRVDHVIEHIAFDGTLLGRLPADAGTQIQTLAVIGDAASAIVRSEKHTRAIAIDLATHTWGAKSAELAIDDSSAVVLAPDGKALVAFSEKDKRLARFDLATGKSKIVCPEPSGFRFHGRFNDEFGSIGSQSGAFAVGILGTKVACFVDNVFSWWNIEDGATTTVSLTTNTSAVFAVTADRIVAGADHQLVIQTPERIDYLGYGFRDLTHVRSVATGLMIGKGDQEPVLLDENFRERARFQLPKLRVDWTDVAPVDDRYILTSSTRPGTGDMWGGSYQIGLYDTVKQVMHQVLPHRARGGEIAYEPATQLLLASDGNKDLLLKLDATTHALGNEVELQLSDVPKKITLVDPKLANGAIAIAVQDESGGGLLVSEFHRADVPPAQEVDGKYVVRTMKPRKMYRIAGELRGVDRAGKVYVFNVMYADAIGVYVGGEAKAQLAGAQTARLRASPDGKHAIAVENGRLTLYATEGKKLWETAAWGSSDVDWTPAGVLYARFPHALARIDTTTGALAERQCGWGFGISATPREGSTSAPSVCDVAP
jgi:hypothetical protein